jgi:hypothetical protein
LCVKIEEATSYRWKAGEIISGYPGAKNGHFEEIQHWKLPKIYENRRIIFIVYVSL